MHVSPLFQPRDPRDGVVRRKFEFEGAPIRSRWIRGRWLCLATCCCTVVCGRRLATRRELRPARRHAQGAGRRMRRHSSNFGDWMDRMADTDGICSAYTCLSLSLCLGLRLRLCVARFHPTCRCTLLGWQLCGASLVDRGGADGEQSDEVCEAHDIDALGSETLHVQPLRWREPIVHQRHQDSIHQTRQAVLSSQRQVHVEQVGEQLRHQQANTHNLTAALNKGNTAAQRNGHIADSTHGKPAG